MTLVQYPQERHGAELEKLILALEDTAWPGSSESGRFPSEPDTYAASFVWLENDMAVCHAGIRKCVFTHRGREYLAYGLSEVVTHPRYQNQGLASKAVERAAQFIKDQRPDVSIFTCEEKRVPFYTRGGWEAVPGACLVGGTKERPFRSDELGLVTMMMFLSDEGRRRRAELEHGDIFLELGENQLW